MPQYPALTEDQFNQVADRVVASAPEGLDETAFNALLDQEVAKAEAFNAMVASGKQNLSRDLSMGAGLATGGAGLIPSAIAAGGAYYLGERMQGKDEAEAAKGALREGATGLVVGGGLKALAGPVSRILDSGAMRAVKGGLKVPLRYLEHMAGAGKAGADAMEDRIARTVLDSGVNPMRAKGARALQGEINTTAASRQADIDAAPNVPGPGTGRRSLNATFEVQQRRVAQTDPSKDLRQIRKVREGMVAHPRYGVDPQNPQAGMPDLTPRQLAEAIEADNRVLAESFGGTPDHARLDAIKAVRGQRAEDLDAVAGTRAKSERLRDLIDVRNVADLARQRAGKRDAIGITDIISLSAGRPEVLLATTLMRPAMQVGLGRALQSAGRTTAGADSVALREAIRALLGQTRLAVSHAQE